MSEVQKDEQKKTPAVFDAAVQFDLKLRAPGGVKTVRVRFPSDAEWIEHQRQRKVFVRNLGRGRSETTVPGAEEADAALIGKIHESGDVEVDPYEAGQIVDRLQEGRVDDVISEGDDYRVRLRVFPGVIVSVVLGVPSARELFEYKRNFFRAVDMPHGKQEITIRLDAGAKLFDKLLKGSEGYVAAVPIIHKAAVLKAVVEAVESVGQEDPDESF